MRNAIIMCNMKPFFHAPRRIFKKYFIAHGANNHHPHIFRTKAVLTFLTLILVIEGGLFLYIGRPIEINSQQAAVIANKLIAYTNEERVAENLSPLTRNSKLDIAAQKKAEDMIEKGYFAHFSPEGISPWHWINEAGYRYVIAGENLAIDFIDSKDVVNAWMNSPGHRKNIMKQKYTEIGMAVADGVFENRRTTFVVQYFATPAMSVTANDDESISTVVTVPISSTSTGAYVAGISTGEIPTENLFARVTSEMFGFTVSPRNSVEVVIFILIACVVVATLLYIHGSKNPIVHRKVAFISISLLIVLVLLVMVNRTFLRMTEDSIGPATETSLEIVSR